MNEQNIKNPKVGGKKKIHMTVVGEEVDILERLTWCRIFVRGVEQ